MENWFSSIMEFLIQKRLRAWKWIEVAYFVPNFSDTIWTLVRDLIAYCVLVHSFYKGSWMRLPLRYIWGLLQVSLAGSTAVIWERDLSAQTVR